MSVGERRFGLTPEEAEDVLQDTFEAVFTKRPRVRNVEGPDRTTKPIGG